MSIRSMNARSSASMKPRLTNFSSRRSASRRVSKASWRRREPSWYAGGIAPSIACFDGARAGRHAFAGGRPERLRLEDLALAHDGAPGDRALLDHGAAPAVRPRRQPEQRDQQAGDADEHDDETGGVD